ncbi:hypothetical protein [Micromonospora sp. SL4-19]|uniref:hypothetical protein n=1 Tax=Micromonospora sp. SL4-19 TaxID=3399129 RepID=UPI003A4E14EF
MKLLRIVWSGFGWREREGLELGLAVVRDLRDRRAPASAEDIERFEVDVLAGFVLALSTTREN